MKLPLVTDEVIMEITDKINKEGNSFLERIATIVKRENPKITSMLLGVSDVSNDKGKVIYAGLITYYLLKRQLETEVKKHSTDLIH